MPELPEVEIVRRSLDARLPGHEITSVWVRSDRFVPTHPVPALKEQLIGSAFDCVDRRGKYLFLVLTSGQRLVVHLRMTGRLLFSAGRTPPAGGPQVLADQGGLAETEGLAPRHVHLMWGLDPAATLLFHDVRKFGRVYLLQPGPLATLAGAPTGLRQLGPEPFAPELTGTALCRQAANRRRSIKSLLLDQSFVAGIGNIYADEALYQAGIHPRRPAGQLDKAAYGRLLGALRRLCRRAIGYAGTTLNDFRDGLGQSGDYSDELQVYGREEAACRRCDTPIQKIKLAGRGTHFCPECQEEAE